MALFASKETGRKVNPHSGQAAVRWQDRDQRIIDFIYEHPATADQIARTFFSSPTPETTRKKANRRLNRLSRKRLIRAVGMVLLRGTGRPQYVYSGQRCKVDMLEHEVWITEFHLLHPQFPFQRNVPVGRTIADGFMEKDRTKLFVEVDTGKMDHRQIETKWRRYTGVEGFILVICLTERRMQQLRVRCKRVKSIALFSTFDRLRSGQDEPWIDGYGKTAAI